MSFTSDNARNTRNFMAHGGNELVIGGKLTILPTAELDDQASLLHGASAPARMAHQAESTASTVAALRDDFNALLGALSTAGFMAPVAETTPEDDTASEAQTE